MEAKDTVMNSSELRLLCVKAYKDATGEVVSPFAIDMTCPVIIAQAQAEITFKEGYNKAVKDAVEPIENAFKGGKRAGIREVVEWLKDRLEGGDFMAYFLEQDFKAQGIGIKGLK